MLPNLSYLNRKAAVLVSLGRSKDVAHQTASYRFFSDVVWVGLGQLFMSLTGLVVLPALTKNYPTELYGLWSQMVVTIGLLRILTLKFESATIRFLAAEDSREKRRQALGTMLWPILALISILLVISLLLRNSLTVFLFTDLEFAAYVPLVMVWSSVEALFFFSLSYQRARGNIKRFSAVRLASSVVRMLVIVSLAAMGYSFYWLVVSVIAIQAVFTVGTLAMAFLELGFLNFNFSSFKGFLGYSVPLLPGELLYWINSLSDRYFIAHILNISQTGIYSASYALANLLMLLSWPIGVVLFPSVSRLWERGDQEKVKSYFQYSMKFFLVLSIPATAGLSILSQPLLRILATGGFEAGRLLVFLLSVGATLAGVFLINEYTIYLVKRTAWLPLINATGAVINVGINIILIPRIGILGAAISTVVSYFIISVIIAIWGRRNIRYKFDFMFIFKVIGATAIMVASLWFFKIDSIIGLILAAIGGAVVYGVVLYLLRAISQEDRKVISNILSGLGISSGGTMSKS